MQYFIFIFTNNCFWLFKFWHFVTTEKMGFGLLQMKTPQPELPYSRVVIITSTLGIWPALNSLRDDTAAVYVLLLDQIEKKRNASSISFKWFGISKQITNTDLKKVWKIFQSHWLSKHFWIWLIDYNKTDRQKA